MSMRSDRAIDYEQQTDDREVLELLAGIKDVLDEAGLSNNAQHRIERALRAMVWRTLMSTE